LALGDAASSARAERLRRRRTLGDSWRVAEDDDREMELFGAMGNPQNSQHEWSQILSLQIAADIN